MPRMREATLIWNYIKDMQSQIDRLESLVESIIIRQSAAEELYADLRGKESLQTELQQAE